MKKKSASQSAFFKLRVLLAVLLCFGAITNRSAGAAANALRPDQAIHSRSCSAQYRGVMPVVKFDISPPLRSMKPLPAKECTLRENEDRDILAHLAPLGPVVPDPVVQRVLGKIGIPAPIISFRWEQQPVRLLAPGPQWSGRSQSRGDDGQPAFPNFQQERELALRSGSEQHALGGIWWGLPDR